MYAERGTRAAIGGRLPVGGSDARGLPFLSHSLVAVPPGRFSLQVVNAAGVTILRESGVGPTTCDLSSLSKGMHFVTTVSGGMAISRVFLNVK